MIACFVSGYAVCSIGRRSVEVRGIRINERHGCQASAIGSQSVEVARRVYQQAICDGSAASLCSGSTPIDWRFRRLTAVLHICATASTAVSVGQSSVTASFRLAAASLAEPCRVSAPGGVMMRRSVLLPHTLASASRPCNIRRGVTSKCCNVCYDLPTTSEQSVCNVLHFTSHPVARPPRW